MANHCVTNVLRAATAVSCANHKVDLEDVEARAQTNREELLLRLPLLHRQVVLRPATAVLSALRKHRVFDDPCEQAVATPVSSEAEVELVESRVGGTRT